MDIKSGVSRRALLGGGITVAACLAAPVLAAGPRGPRPRFLALNCAPTGEMAREVYWADGQYVQSALDRFDWLLRDFRVDEMRAIDPALLDTLHAINLKLGNMRALQVISGYRSPATNQMLAHQRRGVARNSLHTLGMAIDIRIPGYRGLAVRDAARSLRRGGVGYYPRADFVHLDSGAVRQW